ncbi:MAG: amino acid ABC transporter ATP-binding protein, partial [Ruminiclostridium sp.]|nr:amino acid ABC transporter ATP-binding protein [Ruminiclostridium sp.]
MLEVKDLGKSFKDLEVLKSIDLKVKKGGVVAIIGPSGSGKSTMLRCLNRLEEPTKGQILFHGENILDKKVDINKIRMQIGMVFQQFNLFPHLTVRRNITIALTKLRNMPEAEANATADRLLEMVGLAEKADV